MVAPLRERLQRYGSHKKIVRAAAFIANSAKQLAEYGVDLAASLLFTFFGSTESRDFMALNFCVKCPYEFNFCVNNALLQIIISHFIYQ